jgi:hypothetical protein
MNKMEDTRKRKQRIKKAEKNNKTWRLKMRSRRMSSMERGGGRKE